MCCTIQKTCRLFVTLEHTTNFLVALLNFLPITVESHNKTLFVVSLNDTELETSAKIRLCNVIKFFRVKQVLTFQALKVTALIYKYTVLTVQNIVYLYELWWYQSVLLATGQSHHNFLFKHELFRLCHLERFIPLLLLSGIQVSSISFR